LCRIYQFLGFPVKEPADKRLTHSLPGILFMGGSAVLLLFIPVLLVFPAYTTEAGLFMCGLFLGMGLHLAEDLCTRKGISPFFPFSQVMIAGSIRPCDRTDPRIGWYHLQHGAVLLAILACEGYGILSPALALPISFAGIAACLGFMVYSSDITVRQEAGTSGRVTVPSPAQSPGRI
jgi:UDP-N-acetylmuramyl pentapeptide phosphotransferase/UDP-N-acetylglucosamine-1-phosphate transferase